MYRQILINPEHRQFQHILWRPTPQDALIVYELNTVTYGVNCVPFLALRVLHAIAADDSADAEAVRYALTHQTYVDDICVGADSVGDALDLQAKLISTLGKSMLELKKWSSNTSAILGAVPEDSRKIGPLPFESAEDIGTKVLGLEWQPLGDYFSSALNTKLPPVYTKRGVLSLVARIFDPLGLFGPSTFLAKSIMQRTWAYGLSLDDPLPRDIQIDWSKFVSELHHITRVKVPRHFGTSTGMSCHLFGFGDASQRGYAAVVYLCAVGPHGVHSISLVGSKTKLAPLKRLSIPRLELNATLLLARWLHRVEKIVSPQLDILGTHAWTDSTIVLSWLTIPHECFKQYVSNRVHQIRSLLPTCQWRHVDSGNNPADCASRGVNPSELVILDLYWYGPEFIRDDPSTWPLGPPPIPSLVARLCPFIDNDGIIRVGGRLHHSGLPFEQKHPVLLAKNSHLSLLLCRHWHILTCHSGPRAMSSLINRRYWIISLRSAIRSVISHCTVCARFDAATPQPIMADLPLSRVLEYRVFTRVGVDYAGPLQVRDLQLRKSRVFKAYIAIFVCFAVKAVHLELVTDLSTEAFLAAFDRFVARRGLPTDVFSDCGTNFVGAAKQLRQLINSQPSADKIASKAYSCTWHFNPPGAPHFGGLWEAAVRSAKRLLVRVLGSHTFP